MKNTRLIGRLDVKGEHLVKGIQFEGLRKLGRPNDFARRYYADGVDELIYIDIVASLYQRNGIFDLVEEATRDIFVPITVGGGLRSTDDVACALRAGADKVAINTAAVGDPLLISQVAERFGSQCMVLSIEAKRTGADAWEAYANYGRDHTGLDAVAWARRGYELGAGEILLTSVDREGTAKGSDLDLIARVTAAVPIPVIAGGGIASAEHVVQAVRNGGSDAVAMARALHGGDIGLPALRRGIRDQGLMVRELRQMEVGPA